MLSHNKFLGKCWYGRQPWIRLAMESESMVEKGINFIFCLGTAYDISSMESVGNYSVIFVNGKSVGVLGTGVPRLACLRPAAWLKGRPSMAHLQQHKLKTLARGQAS